MKTFSLLLTFLLIGVLLVGCGGGSGGRSLSYTVLSGTVVDIATHNPIPGVQVKIGVVCSTTTDTNGGFTTPQFVSGTYDIVFSKSGYATKTFFNLILNIGTYAFDNPISIQTGSGSESPSIIKDVPVAGGSGQITINANKNIGTLAVIPYNTTLTTGSYSTTVSVSADSTNLSIIPVTSKNSSLYSSIDPYNVIRQQERQLVSSLIAGGIPYSMKNSYSTDSSFINDNNTTRTFWKSLNNFWFSITATKKYGSASTKCQIYMQNGISASYLSDSYITQLGQAFDSYYQTEVNYFGNPDGTLGDIDHNAMIYILITELDHENSSWVAGYFSGINEFPNSSYVHSNQMEMIYITTYKPNTAYWSDSKWLSTMKGTLAHEFQHLSFFNNRLTKYHTDSEYDSETWINEGLSMVAEDLAVKGPGYIHNSDLDDRVAAYLGSSTANSLCTWNDTVGDYAPAYMFMRYFIDRYTESSINSLITSNSLGTNMLTSVASGTAFTQLFRDWLAAVVLDRLNYNSYDATFNNNYLYKTLTLSTTSTYPTFGTEGTGTMSIPDSAGGFILETGLSNKQQITVSIHGNSVFGLRLIMIPASGSSFSLYEETPNLIRIQ